MKTKGQPMNEKAKAFGKALKRQVDEFDKQDAEALMKIQAKYNGHKNEDGNIDIVSVDKITRHRNGCGGIGFEIVFFTMQDDNQRRARRMVGLVFDNGKEDEKECDGYCAVMDRSMLAVGDVEMFGIVGGNAWRGDHFEPILRKIVYDYGRYKYPPVKESK